MPNPKKPNPERQPEESQGDHYQVSYANHTGIVVTPWDFAFRFGRITAANEKELKAQIEACVYMSPQHAKAFFGLMERQVKLYEQKFGTIPEPKQPMEALAKKGRPIK